jgi:uncharacterized protein DUF6894
LQRFYFHTDCESRFNDVEGQELADVASARVAAACATAEILKDGAGQFWGTRPWTMTVTDANGLIFFQIEVHGQNSPANRMA